MLIFTLLILNNENMRRNFKSLLDLDLIKRYILENKSLPEISKLINVPAKNISYFLIKNRISVKKINPYNKDYFKVIDSEVKAYILGYIVADGSIIRESRIDRPSTIDRIQFQCAVADLEILELIKAEICPDNKITFIKSKTINRQDTVRLRVANREIVNDLITLYNIHERKTYNDTFRFPNISEEYKRHFIRGFIDGDGSIGNKHFSMICNSPLFLNDILAVIKSCIPDITYNVYKENRKYTNYWSLHFNVNKKSRFDIFNFLYKDTCVRLSRKYNKALNAVLNSKTKELLSV